MGCPMPSLSGDVWCGMLATIRVDETESYALPFGRCSVVSIRPIAPIRPIGLTPTHLLALLHLLALG